MTGSPSSGSGSSYDGHLDLDDLDLTTSLDVVGDDEPRLSDRIAEHLEAAGITPWLRRHRAVLAGVAAVAVVGLVLGGAWWLHRPVPLPASARLLVKVSGPDPTARVLEDPSGRPVSVAQDLSLTTAERTGVEVAVALTGPGLRDAAPERFVVMDRSEPDDSISVPADLDCATPATTTAVLAAGPDDFGVLLRRTAPEGESRVDRLPFIGAQTLAQLVRRSCLQLAADRDLTTSAVSAVAVPGVVAVDLDVEVTNTSTRSWSGLRVSPGAMPAIINGGRRPDLEPGQVGHVRARLWPQDCADPAAALAAGLPLQADLGPDGNPPSTSLGSPSFTLLLPAVTAQVVGSALAASCGTEVPRLTVDRARLRAGSDGTLAGIIDIGVTLEAPDADYVEAEAAGAFVVGQLSSLDTPAHVHGGVATMRLRWALPGCAAVLRAGRPQLAVTLVGDPRRPYLLDLRGESLRLVVNRLCGDEVAAVVA